MPVSKLPGCSSEISLTDAGIRLPQISGLLGWAPVADEKTVRFEEAQCRLSLRSLGRSPPVILFLIFLWRVTYDLSSVSVFFFRAST